MKKALFPYIREAAIIIFCIVVVLLSLAYGDFVTITMSPHIISIAFCLGFLVLLILNCKAIILGFKAFFDLIFKSTNSIKGKIITQIPKNGSWFTETFGENYQTITDVHFVVVIKTNDKRHIHLLSSEYIDVNDDIIELIVSKRAGIIIEKKMGDS